MSSFKSSENIQKKVYRADCTVLNTKFSSVTLSGNESQRKGMVISSFNKAANRKADIDPNGVQITKTCLEYMCLDL